MRTADNRVRTLIGLYEKELSGLYSDSEVKAILRAVFQYALTWDASMLEFRKDEQLSESELIKVYDPLKRLQAGEPLQYVLGQVRFHDVDLHVAPGVLIPRPETEELVQLILDKCGTPARIVDVGTGSGCIALALKKALPESLVTGIDRSVEALEIARRNAARNDLQVEWLQADVLDPSFEMPQADLVVSNPPYVPRHEAAELEPQVREHEPHLALFVDDDDPCLFYRVIGAHALKVLAPGGRLWFEGHYKHAEAVGELLREQGFRKVQVLKDLSGLPRFIGAER